MPIPPPTSTRTILGPLTTTFTPPARCSTLHWFALEQGGWGQTYACQSDATSSSDYPRLDEGCFPPNFASRVNAIYAAPFTYVPPDIDTATFTYAFFSPAIACPSGFTQGGSVVRKDGETPPPSVEASAGRRNMWFLLTAGETAYGCCPR